MGEFVVCECLKIMCAMLEEDTETWLEIGPEEDLTDNSHPHTYEHSLDRVPCALRGQAGVQPTFMSIRVMLARHHWRSDMRGSWRSRPSRGQEQGYRVRPLLVLVPFQACVLSAQPPQPYSPRMAPSSWTR